MKPAQMLTGMSTDDSLATIERLEDELANVRAALEAVRADRDRLERQVASLGEMQTQTVVLDGAEDDDTVDDPPLPSLDALIANLDFLAEANEPPEHSASATGVEDMIDPSLMFPDGYKPDEHSPADEKPESEHNSRVLVCTDLSPPIKYPLYKERLTIGRSESVDICVRCDHVSRVHARIFVSEDGVVVEDAGSRNGIKVNAKPVECQELRHGDVLSVGKLHYTFIDTT